MHVSVTIIVILGLVCPASMAALLQTHCQVGSELFDSSTSFGSPRYLYANSGSDLPVNMDFLGPGFSQFALVPVLGMFQLHRGGRMLLAIRNWDCPPFSGLLLEEGFVGS